MTTKILLIDNYDSFTYNIAHYIGMLGSEIDVVKNDDPLLKRINSLSYTHIILSPGPGSPAESGFTFEVIDVFHRKLPILGICLGHQCLAQFFGARIIHADVVMHGKTSVVYHTKDSIFAGLPQSFNVVRYHSLLIELQSLPACLEMIAWTQNSQNIAKEIMAIKHQDYPIFGVQYHPEAFLTEYGLEVLKNFIAI